MVLERRDADYLKEEPQVNPQDVKARVEDFFEGIDLSVDGKHTKGLFDIEITIIETTSKSGEYKVTRKGINAIAIVSGFRAAEIYKPTQEIQAEPALTTYKLTGQLHRDTDGAYAKPLQVTWVVNESANGALSEYIEPFDSIGEIIDSARKVEVARALGVKV